MRRKLRNIVLPALVLAGGIFFANSNLFVASEGGTPTLLAHRGVAQRYDNATMDRDGCSATRMPSPTHDYLENTIRSMRAAFEAGADLVEFDVHPTTDGQFAVFHDWTLDCRTDGHGVTREHSMAELRALDIGYGYTADGGKSFPFRGKGRGLMPTMDEVLSTFPDRRFLVNVKSNDPREGTKLAAVLAQLPPERRALLVPYGGDKPIEEIRRLLPDTKVASRSTVKACLLSYAAYGWTGLVPDACRNLVLLVPTNVAPWLWGWPERFLARMGSVGSEVFVVAPWSGGGTSGIDTPADLATLPDDYSGGIWTNGIEVIGPMVKGQWGGLKVRRAADTRRQTSRAGSPRLAVKQMHGIFIEAEGEGLALGDPCFGRQCGGQPLAADPRRDDEFRTGQFHHVDFGAQSPGTHCRRAQAFRAQAEHQPAALLR